MIRNAGLALFGHKFQVYKQQTCIANLVTSNRSSVIGGLLVAIDRFQLNSLHIILMIHWISWNQNLYYINAVDLSQDNCTYLHLMIFQSHGSC